MSEICGVYWIEGELKATDETSRWLDRAEQGELNDEFCLPEMLPRVGHDGVIAMNWHGMGAEQSVDEGALASFLTTTTGRADFALVDEYGETMIGVRAIDGKMSRHIVNVSLGDEIHEDDASDSDEAPDSDIPDSDDMPDSE